VYVDDIVLTGNDDREIQNLKHREGIIYTPYVKKREQLANMLTNRVSSSILQPYPNWACKTSMPQIEEEC